MIYLASNSPRRKELMTAGGWAFQVLAAPVDETPLPGEAPSTYVRRLAESKARAALAHMPAGAIDALLVAADTTVADVREDGAFEILGKPQDADDARRMLRQLSGRMHVVLTGMAVLRASDESLLSDVDVTEVWMRPYTEAELQVYVASGDPMDKAGAYAIQHAGFHPVERLHGCFANVMGLPVCCVARLLAQLGAPAAASKLAACRLNLDAPCDLSRDLTQ
jgi:MAF protein